MNRFIKKNLFLVGVLAISALGVLILLVLSITQYIEMSKYINRTEEMRKQNETLMRQKPPAVQENIALVQQDIKGYAAAVEDLKSYFGHPLYPALKKFAAELKLTPAELCEKFKAFWEKEKDSQGPREQTYRRFRATCGAVVEGDKKLWELGAWDEALDNFVEAAQKTTMETIDERNREEIFLSALGLPRNMGKNQARLDAFARDMQNKVIDLLTDKNDITLLGVYFTERPVPELRTNEDFEDQAGGSSAGPEDGAMGGERKNRRASSASSDMMGPGGMGMGIDGAMGEDENKPEPADTIRNWEIIGDLAQRMAKAKIDSVEEVSYSNLLGREENGCHYYTYSVSIVGGENEIRAFLNLLYDAYSDNRVYVVRNLSIEKQEDQVQDIIDVAQGILADKGEEDAKLTTRNDAAPMGGMSMTGSMGAPGMPQQQQTRAAYFKEEGKYGECVAGRSNVCAASLVLDYVVYSADILK